MVFWSILGILLIIDAVCLIIVLIHTSEEKINIIISYFVFIFGCFNIIEYVNQKQSMYIKVKLNYVSRMKEIHQ